MNETVGGGTDISGQADSPGTPEPAEVTHPTRVTVPRRGVPRRFLSLTMAMATVVLTVVGVLAVLLFDPPSSPSVPVTGPDRSLSPLPAPTARQCWTGDRVLSDQPCPQLEGRQGLTWLVIPSTPFDECVPFTDERAPGELEVYDCLWTSKGADVFISRWDRIGSARVYFDDQGKSQRTETIPGGRGAMTWTSDDAAYPFRATVYLDAPYSVNVVGLTVADRDAALARIQVRPPADVAQQGADR